MANPVGSVTAEIILDTKQFEEAIGKLKGEVKEIKESFTKSKGNDGLLKEVEQLKKEIDSLQSKTKSYQDTIKNLREQNADYAKGIENLNKLLEQSKKQHSAINDELKVEQKSYDNASKSASKYIKLADRMTKWSVSTFKKNLSTKGMGDIFNLGTGRSKFAEFSQWIKGLNTGLFKVTLKPFKDFSTRMRESIQQIRGAWSQSTYGMTGYINLLNQITQAHNRLSKSTNKIKNISEPFSVVQAELERTTTLIKTTFVETQEGIEAIKTPIARVSEVLATFNFKLIEMADSEDVAARKAVQLSSAMHSLYQGFGAIKNSGKQNTGYGAILEQMKKTYTYLGKTIQGGDLSQLGSRGRINTLGYSDYTANITKVNQSLQTQARLAKEAKLANEGLSQAYNKTGINLNTYRANITKVTRELEKQRLRTAQVEAAQASLYYKNAPNNLNTYKANITKINEQLQRQTTNQNNVNNSLKTGQASMRQFGTTMGKSEAYANNLYRGLQKVRSVIVSIKTIAGALGTMAVWNFAFDLIDKAKETYIAKNEMEALLAKNSHIDVQGQQAFNRALDKTVERFQKINKYSLGETAASVGLEFDLNGKQMAKSLDIIAMVQNEYVRAGRTTEEAALAVKDILQGEFQRLSRETGIGKDDLKDKYGWSGDKEDIEGLMDALNKAGKARHWDAFAEKATSLNDVITITQSRFSEFGADLITNIEPMLVSGFNSILSVVDALKNGFQNMNGAEQIITVTTVAGSTIVGLSTLAMILKKNMGLLEIATMGWTKSLGTSIFGLNRANVAAYGFKRTLLATLTGTEAATTANVRFSKVLAGNILGVRQATLAEHGLMNAVVQSKLALKGETLMISSAELGAMSFSQKLKYVIGNMSIADAKTASWGKTIKSLITSTRFLKLALVGIPAIGLVAWLSSVAMWTSTVKKRMDAFNDTLNNGSEELKTAKNTLSQYEDKLAKLSKNSKNYDFMKSQRDTAKSNVKDLQLSLKLAKQIKKQDKELTESHDLTTTSILNQAYERNGVDTEKYSQKYLQMRQAAYDIKRAEEERYKFQYQSLQHINEHVSLMEKAGIDEEKRVKYITEYSAKAKEAAENLKKFNEGDLNAGFYYLMDRAALVWIDLWNDKDFIVFWNSVKKTFNDLKPTLKTIVDLLTNLGRTLMKFFSTDVGRWTLAIGAMGVGIGAVVGKLSKWITGNNLVIDGLKKLGQNLVQRIKDWDLFGKKAEEANKKSGGTTPTTTGGTVPSESDAPLKEQLGKQLKADAVKYARAAVAIVAGMALITEAIVLLRMPMAALAEQGWQFKQWEPEIRQGIEGIKLIAPVVLALLPPVIVLSLIMDKFEHDMTAIVKGTGKAAVAIAAGMLLVAESIVMLVAPMGAIAALGWVNNALGNGVQDGINAINLIGKAVMSLVPVIPVFVAAIAIGAVTIATGGTGFALMAGGLAIGMLGVATAIITLAEPLLAIAALGYITQDINAVKKGCEAIKVTAEALTYLTTALGALVLVDLELLGATIAQLVNKVFDINLTDLTKEGGLFSQLNTFITEFNKYDFVAPVPEKVEALKGVGDGMTTINTALESVKKAMENIPDEFKNGNQGKPLLNYNAETGNTTITDKSSDYQGYFDSLKEPLKQLKQFIDEFNTSPDFDFTLGEDFSARVSAIQQAGNMITTLNTAVQNVKSVMQNTGGAGWETNYAQGGILQAVAGFFGLNNTGTSGAYSSTLGSSFEEMENIIKDMTTFTNRISGLTGGDSNVDVSGLASMVQQVITQINKLKQTVSDAVPQLKTSSKGLGSAIGDGLLEGFNTKIAVVAPQIGNKLKSMGTTTLVPNFKQGIDKMSEAMGWELYYVGKAIDDKYDELGEKAYNLAKHMSDRFRDGDDMHSPGIMARSMQDEMGYIGQYLQEGITNLPQMAYDLGNSIASNFNFDLNLGNIQLPDISAFQQGISQIIPTVSNVKTQVSTNFQSMVGSVGTSLMNLKNNATANYNTIANNTRTSLANMQSQTTKNIGGIKTSWRGMQSALIASAEAIRSQTQSKINKIKSNLGDFWNKVKHPDQLLQSAGGKHVGSIHRSRLASVKTPSTGYAGGGSGSLFKPKPRSTASPSDLLEEYFACMATTGKPCYAGGWNYNWTPQIVRKFKGWDTHFNAYSLDKFLNVGKFENSNFPVKGNRDVARAYIFDVIRSTSYAKYFNSRYGDDPVQALLAGVFNCWDGTNIVLGLARAFGFYGDRVYGSWNGVGHVWASIPGLGIIDPTAIQQRGSFKATGAVNYGGGSKRPLKSSDVATGGDTYNTTVNITVSGSDVEVDNRKIDDRTGRQLLDILGINPATGR